MRINEATKKETNNQTKSTNEQVQHEGWIAVRGKSVVKPSNAQSERNIDVTNGFKPLNDNSNVGHNVSSTTDRGQWGEKEQEGTSKSHLIPK